jgi:hypothetical protein
MQVDLTKQPLHGLAGDEKYPRQDRRAHQPVLYFSNDAAANEPSLRSYAQRVQELCGVRVNSHGKLSLR